tara:strand:- start:1255 stop:1398 length:144 start_codon:yes stop_codon:yes gene_type:complete
MQSVALPEASKGLYVPEGHGVCEIDAVVETKYPESASKHSDCAELGW